MTVSKLIELLQDILETYGDLEVLVPNSYTQDWEPVSGEYYSYEGKIYFW